MISLHRLSRRWVDFSAAFASDESSQHQQLSNADQFSENKCLKEKGIVVLTNNGSKLQWNRWEGNLKISGKRAHLDDLRVFFTVFYGIKYGRNVHRQILVYKLHLLTNFDSKSYGADNTCSLKASCHSTAKGSMVLISRIPQNEISL